MLQQFYPAPPAHSFRFELNKDMNFAAAHFVPHHTAGKCQEVHGHTYFVNITVAGNTLDHAGFLVNFQKLKEVVHKRYDHSVMNDHTEFIGGNPGSIPSTENVAKHIWYNVQDMLELEGYGAQCLQVIVRETPTSYVIFRPDQKDIDEKRLPF